jgi:FkbM family methyltransferase
MNMMKQNVKNAFKEYGFFLKNFFFKSLFYSILIDLCTFLRFKKMHNILLERFNKYATLEILRAIEEKYRIKFKEFSFSLIEIFFEKAHWHYPEFYPNGIVLDIGCGIGDYTLLCLKYFNCDKVISIDALSELCEQTKENLRLNGIDKNKAIIVQKAISDKRGSEKILIEGGSIKMAIVSEKGFSKIHSITIDELVEKLSLNSLNIIKMDIEGSELKALRGAKNTLSVFKPRLIVEVHSKALRQSVIDFLKLNHYSVVHEYFYGSNQEMDYVGDIYALPT